MNRKNAISKVMTRSIWDIAIIGGGATGVGTAIEAASRGYKVILIEQSDFGKGTSSRSTKLAHGGVRYLQQGNIALVLDALEERGIMRRNAPHLVHDLPFIVPVYDWWEGPFYGIGLKLYDMLAGKEGFGSSKLLSKEETIKYIPTIETNGLRGGVLYHDGQFDDARLLINMVQTAEEQGAVLINYAKVTSIIKQDGIVNGLEFIDQESRIIHSVNAKIVINATGVFTDQIRQLDDINAKEMMIGSQGVHIVLDQEYLSGNTAIMVPHTDDGRVLFAVPWYNRVLVGTTDTYVNVFPLEPVALDEEIEFLLKHAGRYLVNDPERKDVKSIFVGLRPLVKTATSDQDTASISRDHTISISRSGLVSIAGGKWTTYRKMAEDVIEQAIILGDLEPTNSVSKTLLLHGYHQHADHFGDLSFYGTDAKCIRELIDQDASYATRIHPDYTINVAQVVWAVRQEMARQVEDFLARRTRLLLIDAKASMDVAPVVAEIMAKELQRDKSWIIDQIKKFQQLASNYLINDY